MTKINSTEKINSWLIIILAVSLPFERLLTLPLAGYTLKFSYLFGLIFIGYSLALIIGKKVNFTLYRDELWILLFGLLAILTTLWSIDSSRSLVISLTMIFMIAMFYFLRRQINVELREKVISIFISLGFLVSLFALWQFLIDKSVWRQYSFLRPEYISGVFSFARVQSTFLEPLYFANFLLIPIFFSFYRLISRPSFKGYAFLAVISIAFSLALSRGAFLALAAGLVLSLILIISYQKEKLSNFIKSILIMAAGFLMALVLVFTTSGKIGIQEYFGHSTFADTDTTGSLVNRKTTMKTALAESYKHPLGLGAGAFGALPQFKSYSKISGYQTVNNLYLEILVEEGFLGIILFILFLIYYLINLAREGKENLLFLIVSFGLIAALLVQYLFFSTLYIIYIWVVLATLSPKLLPNYESH